MANFNCDFFSHSYDFFRAIVSFCSSENSEKKVRIVRKVAAISFLYSGGKIVHRSYIYMAISQVKSSFIVIPLHVGTYSGYSPLYVPTFILQSTIYLKLNIIIISSSITKKKEK